MQLYIVGAQPIPVFLCSNPDFVPERGDYVMFNKCSYVVKTITYDFEEDQIYLEV